MSTDSQKINAANLGHLSGIQIIPSAFIPIGYKRTQGDTIYISPASYDYIRSLNAEGTLIALGLFSEMGVKL